jgi:hypothetical protein
MVISPDALRPVVRRVPKGIHRYRRSEVRAVIARARKFENMPPTVKQVQLMAVDYSLTAAQIRGFGAISGALLQAPTAFSFTPLRE